MQVEEDGVVAVKWPRHATRAIRFCDVPQVFVCVCVFQKLSCDASDG